MTKNRAHDESDLPKWLSAASDRIISHMNADHLNSIVSTLNAQFGIKDPMATMKSLKRDGYYISSNGKFYFAKFAKKCNSVDEYREELIKHAQIYRDFEIS
jgi:putative heme iron utilization protein